MPRHFIAWTWSTGPIIVLCFNAAKILESDSAVGLENFLHTRVRSPKPSSTWGCWEPSDSNFMDECRFFTNSCKLDFCAQCFDVLLNFTQIVSSCGWSIPWRFYQRSHFFWLKFFQYLINRSFRRRLIRLHTKIFTQSCNCSVNPELICRVNCSI